MSLLHHRREFLHPNVQQQQQPTMHSVQQQQQQPVIHSVQQQHPAMQPVHQQQQHPAMQQQQQPLYLLTPSSSIPTPLVIMRNPSKPHQPAPPVAAALSRELSPPAQEYSSLSLNGKHTASEQQQQSVAVASSSLSSSVSSLSSPLSAVSSSGGQQFSASATSNTPSKVIHFRNVVADITQGDLLNLCAPFGRVTHILLLKNSQALVQFADLQAAISFVQYYGSPSPNPKTKSTSPPSSALQTSRVHEEEEDEEEDVNLCDSEENEDANAANATALHKEHPHHNQLPPNHHHQQQQFQLAYHHQQYQQYHQQQQYQQQQHQQYIGKAQASIRNINVYPSFSAHQELSKGCLNGGSIVSNSSNPIDMEQEHERKNRILLVTICNVQYLVNVDILHQVFSLYGPIEKIVMFNKTAGLQGLIQYKNVDSAVAAKIQLHGQSLFGNSCSLSIQYSNLQDLTVHQNSDRARDYTKPNLPIEANSYSSLFSQVPYASWYQNAPIVQQQFRDSEKTVLLVSNFNDKLDCDKIFNLFSCYGYIMRIKIFRSKSDHALVQMATNQQASTAITCLKGVELFGKKLGVNFSRHTHITASDASDNLTKDYSRTSANRFPMNASLTNTKSSSSSSAVDGNGHTSKEQQGNGNAKKMRYMCNPTHTIHISNLEQTVDQKDLMSMFRSFGEIDGARLFEHSNKRMALVKFKTISGAAEALCTMHNSPFRGHPIKISFSTNKI